MLSIQLQHNDVYIKMISQVTVAPITAASDLIAYEIQKTYSLTVTSHTGQGP